MQSEGQKELEAANADGVAMVMANAFHWVDRHLDELMADPRYTAFQPAVLGCGVASIVLRSFATELSIKALYMQENVGDAKWGHNLRELFLSLSPETQASVERRFERIRQEKISKGIYSGETEPLVEVLDTHKNDFETWRYINEHLNSDLHTRPTVLNSIIEAAMEEYAFRTALR